MSVWGAARTSSCCKSFPRSARAVILFSGATGPQGRRADRVLSSAPSERPDVRLQVVGTDEAPAGEPGVEVFGTIESRERLAELYARARVFCLPSRYDPYGLSISEAMAYGLPCVITRVGALDEVVLDGETGVVVPPETRTPTCACWTVEQPRRRPRLSAGS